MNDLQRNDQWFNDRLGKVTASRVADVVAKTKSGYSTSRANYMAQLICERLTGQKGDSFSSAAMQWGTEQEPVALAAYEDKFGVFVLPSGFVPHPHILESGASPDGLVEDKGLIEIKCPMTATHMDYLLSGEPPEKYVIQMQWQMACTGREWCDWVSFDPRMPENMRLLVKRIERNDTHILALEKEVLAFLAEMEQKIGKLKEKFDGV